MESESVSEQIDAIIRKHGSWKAEILSRLRAVIKSTDPEIIEDIKWKTPTRPEGLPVWSRDGILCIAETWKDNIKLIFFKGTQINDPNKLFNARLNSRTDRAIEFHKDDIIDEIALKALVIEAVRLNITKVPNAS